MPVARIFAVALSDRLPAIQKSLKVLFPLLRLLLGNSAQHFDRMTHSSSGDIKPQYCYGIYHRDRRSLARHGNEQRKQRIANLQLQKLRQLLQIFSDSIPAPLWHPVQLPGEEL